jgi:hypothetical protein
LKCSEEGLDELVKALEQGRSEELIISELDGQTETEEVGPSLQSDQGQTAQVVRA